MPRTSPIDRTQVLPFPGASDLHLRIARCFALITDWNAALGGRFPVADVIGIFTRQVGAYNVALYRLDAGKVRPIATKADAYATHTPELSSGALARYLFDTRLEALTPGSIWRLKDMRRENGFAYTAPALEWDQRPEICEVALIVLETSGDQIDIIEMIFDTPPRPSPDLPVSIITQAMADGWSMRAPGLIARVIRTYGRNRSGRSVVRSGNFLSNSNPSGLSRAEQRVCQLLAVGTKAKDIAESLGVSIPTVRSHLRNIYAKTGTSGQIELIAVINQNKVSAA